MTESDATELVFMPALIVLLTRAEQLATRPLTEAEVLRIRDGAVCMPVAPAVAAQMTEQRGYADLNPENAWAEWQAFRQTSQDS